MVEFFVDIVHRLSAELALYLNPVRDFLLHKYPHTREIAAFVNAFNGALAVHGQYANKPSPYWLQSLVLTAFAAFGGGILAPIVLGKQSAFLANDFIIFSTVIAWYTVFHLNIAPWLNWKPIKLLWSVFVGLFRTYSVIGITDLANSSIAAGPYYPIPLFGPIIAGTLVGSLGAFLPFDKGLNPISKFTPWALQGAFLSAALYHLLVKDEKGIVGYSLRLILGNYSRDNVILIIAALHIIHLELHVLFTPDVNLLTPIHKFLYLIFQVQGPILENNKKPYVGWDLLSRYRLSTLLEAFAIIITISIFLLHTRFTVPPVSISTSQDIFPKTLSTSVPSSVTFNIAQKYNFLVANSIPYNGILGTCHFFKILRSCQPYVVRLENSTSNEGLQQLAVYNLPIDYYQYNEQLNNDTVNPIDIYPFNKKSIGSYLHITADGSLISWALNNYNQAQGYEVKFNTIGKMVPLPTETATSIGDYKVCAKISKNTEDGNEQVPGLKANILKIQVDPTNGGLIGLCAKKSTDEL